MDTHQAGKSCKKFSRIIVFSRRHKLQLTPLTGTPEKCRRIPGTLGCQLRTESAILQPGQAGMQPDCGAADDGEEDGHAVVPWIPGCADEDDGHEWEAGAWSGFDEFDEWDDEWKDAGMEFARQLTEREDSDTLAEHPETPFDDDVDAAPQADVNHVVGPAAASCSMSFGKPQQTTRGGAAAASNVPSSSIDGRDGNTSASAARVDYPDTAEGGTPPRLAATEEAGARDDTQAERTPATLTPENAETIARATALAVAAAAAQPQGAAVGHPNAAGAAPQDGEGQAPVPQTTFRVKVSTWNGQYVAHFVCRFRARADTRGLSRCGKMRASTSANGSETG
eukprot:2208250-Rhodomonas_salina.3